ncbi:MAG: (2Fe-2S)-binding protein [Betaproteobacteria bacterium]
MYICICNAITEREVRECAANGNCSLEELAAALGVGAGCGRCRDCAAEILKSLEAATPPVAA